MEEKMKKISFAVLVVGLLLAACAVRSGYHGEAYIAPALPTVVILEEEPYYVYSGYHYHYTNNVWFYSSSRSGPWKELPRDRWPKEVKHKHKERGWEKEKGERHERRD